VDIEQVAERHPERISKIKIDYLSGLQLLDARKLVSELGVSNDLVDELSDIACKLYAAFKKWDVNTIEINPLILTKD